ncbi:unnamed protein product [Nesidiocoris tenuis]|uniref:Aminopeptidase P N-terminal domain-containing protein n=1 Tax=Nesidiocoris tenuis TaxID=355587 RepID=A0A6H5GD51_9HEMI|nr:unnamed protein product [Nesidiocoris tenuis]
MPADVILAKLRQLFDDKSNKLDGYMVTSFDQHHNEYIATHDRRLEYLTGFSGSAGTAIVTANEAVLWVDGRYHIQASNELRSPFVLMKTGKAGVLSESDWLVQNVRKGSVIGACGKYVSAISWLSMVEKLDSFKIRLQDVKNDLVDIIWAERPSRPCSELRPHPINYSGKAVCDKVRNVREEMIKKNVDMLVLSELDDIAWLLNLRGSDIPYNPVFFSFMIIRLNHIDIFVESLCEPATRQLFEENIMLCDHEYETFYDTLYEMASNSRNEKIWISDKANYKIYRSIPRRKVFMELTPVSMLKCMKNDVEASGMIEAHVYDGYALCKFFCWLEKMLKNKKLVTEISASKALEDFKKRNTDYLGPSFSTISATGPHSAIVHYIVDEESDRPLSTDEVYLCDSGSHYPCGTTDVTRTFHFGSPSHIQKMCYTRVFKGQVSLSTTVFPVGTKGSSLDTLARQHLWKDGLDYDHGTGHGVGAYLNVHESPVSISRRRSQDIALMKNMFVSNEPGFYSDGSFGIRLENVEHVVPASVKSGAEKAFLTFETVTLCPYQTLMLVPDMLTNLDLCYLNSYSLRVRKILCPVFKSEGDMETLKWVMKMTEPLVP